MGGVVRGLSELEGAILSEIEHRGQQTAFQVRRAFAESFSLEWKGSAGAIYPAVRRLEQDGFLSASDPAGGRKTRTLSLTKTGQEALEKWACDPVLAASIGVDPFRLRSGIWSLLPKSKREKLLAKIDLQIAHQIVELEGVLTSVDPVEATRIELALDLQRARSSYIQEWRRTEI